MSIIIVIIDENLVKDSKIIDKKELKTNREFINVDTAKNCVLNSGWRSKIKD